MRRAAPALRLLVLLRLSRAILCFFFLLMVARAGLLMRAAKLTCEVRRDKHRARGLYCVLDVWGARVRWVEIPGHASRASGPNNGFIAGTCVRAPCVPDWWRMSVRARQNKLAKCARGSDTIYLLSLARANFIMHGPGRRYGRACKARTLNVHPVLLSEEVTE